MDKLIVYSVFFSIFRTSGRSTYYVVYVW